MVQIAVVGNNCTSGTTNVLCIKTRNENSDFAERAVGDENWSDITDIIAKAQAHIIAC